MPYACRIEADSINPVGDRLTTFVVTYPRMVHAELMTHRVFSRNSSSSRAIPSEKLIEQVLYDPAGPVWWGKNQSGMQAREELVGEDLQRARLKWLAARDEAVSSCQLLHRVGLHKQIANRLLEPWMWITVVISATEYENFFAQRCHPDAQPEIRHVADMMRALYRENRPAELAAGEWHLPFVRFEDIVLSPTERRSMDELIKLSTARCARVSYLTHDGVRDPSADLGLHDRLVGSGHWSPFEHPAEAMDIEGFASGNYTGWGQYRKRFPLEHRGKRERDGRRTAAP